MIWETNILWQYLGSAGFTDYFSGGSCVLERWNTQLFLRFFLVSYFLFVSSVYNYAQSNFSSLRRDIAKTFF